MIDRHQSAVAFDDAGDVQERSLAPGHAATRFFAGEESPDETNDALGGEADEDDQDHPGDRDMRLRVVGERFAERDDEQRPDQRTEAAARSRR